MATNRKRTPKTDDQVTRELITSVHRHVRSLEARGASEDPWMMAELLDIAAEAEAAALRLVASYRKPGDDGKTPKYRWEDIGFALGIPWRAAYKRYAHKI